MKQLLQRFLGPRKSLTFWLTFSDLQNDNKLIIRVDGIEIFTDFLSFSKNLIYAPVPGVARSDITDLQRKDSCKDFGVYWSL